jgi:hypothetical protein
MNDDLTFEGCELKHDEAPMDGNYDFGEDTDYILVTLENEGYCIPETLETALVLRDSIAYQMNAGNFPEVPDENNPTGGCSLERYLDAEYAEGTKYSTLDRLRYALPKYKKA